MAEHFYICDQVECYDSTIIGMCKRPYVGQELFKSWSTKKNAKSDTLGIVAHVEKTSLSNYDFCVSMSTGISYYLQKK